MKIAQRRPIVSIFSVILFCVVSSGLFALTPQSALASSECSVIPKPNIGYEIPINPGYSSSCESINFGDFAWDAFVALNWPAKKNGKPLRDTMIGTAPNKTRVWEYYESPEQVFQDPHERLKEESPLPLMRLSEFGLQFGSNEKLSKSNDIDSSIFGEGLNPLVDRAGNYILNEIRMNPVEAKQIVANGWNTVEGLKPFATKRKPFELMCSDRFPRGTYPQESDRASVYDNNIPCSVENGNNTVGTIEIKASWMVLPEDKKDLPSWVNPSEYYTTTKSLYVRELATEKATTKVTVPVALVGFHLLHKTSQFGWVWSTFEHIKNAPYDKDLSETERYNIHYNLYDPDCQGYCEVNTPMATPPYLWRPKFPHAVTAKGEPQTPSQITRLVPIRDYAETLNEKWQAALPSVWKNYQLIGVQWLQNPYIPYQALRNVQPGKLANPTLEPYVQKTEIGSCITCHTAAKLPIDSPEPIKADFSFLLKYAKRSSH
ncbi:MAG: hypothetical protein F6J93_05175 [Oscillatoria sp. SIO1A7]|nr:hypothetical protein [Oscillatoria sp. SIO1A7]